MSPIDKAIVLYGQLAEEAGLKAVRLINLAIVIPAALETTSTALAAQYEKDAVRAAREAHWAWRLMRATEEFRSSTKPGN